MKTSFIFIGILLFSLIGTLVGSRAVKTGMLVLCAALSLYGIVRYMV